MPSGAVSQEPNESDQRFSDFARATGDWFWECDAEGRMTWISGGVENLLGDPAESNLGKTRLELAGLAGAPLSPEWKRHLEVLAARAPFRDFRYQRSSALGKRWISASGVPVFDAEGRFRGYRGVGADVTERMLEEVRVKKANDQLIAALERTNESILLCDPEDRIVFTNQRFRESIPDLLHLVVTGTPYIDYIRGAVAAGYFPEAAGREEDWVAERMAQRHAEQGKVSRHRRGDRCWQVSDRRLPDGSTISTTLDITEWKHAEDELRASQLLLERVIDAIPMSIFAKDLDSNYVMVNQYMADFFGSTKDALLLHHTSELPSRDATRQQSLRDDQWVYGNRQPLVHETLIQRPDGTPVPYHSSKIPLFDANGELSGLLGINRDITEQKQAQAQLHASEQLFSAMFHDSPAAMSVVDPETRRFMDVNRAFVELFGYAREQVVGRTSAEFGAVVDPEDRRLLYEALMRDRYVDRHRLTSRTASGRINLCLVSGRVIRVGEQDRVLFSFSDITELSEAHRRIEEINATLEDRVRERTAQLESANSELEAFSYSVSHDLKAPLRAIDGAVGILRMKHGDQLPAEAETYLSRISTSARRMAKLIEGLLEFARLSRQAIHRIEVRPEEIVSQLVQRQEEQVRQRGALVTVGPMPACQADPLLLTQVFENLVSNALKYSAQAQPPEIAIGATESDGEVEYYVRDNGVGFDMAYVHKLFGVFERLHAPELFEGTGIGLALVRRIVERHGGRIRAESSGAGGGATFYFTIGGPG